jgi:branched-chain amino acid transport system permease protein
MLQLAVNTLALGSAYALVAMGFVLILNATNAVNFAHGGLVMFGSFIAISLAGAIPLPGIAILPLLFILAMGLGLLLALVAYFPLRHHNVVAVFISTISAAAIFENGALLIYGPEPRATPTMLGGGLVEFAGVALSRQSLTVILAAGALVVAQYWLFTRTLLGKRLRAAAQDPEMASAIGLNVNVMIALTFAIAAGLAAAAGMFLSATYFVTSHDGANYTMKAYIAVTIGGWGSIPGALVGAMLVALFEVLIPAIPALFPVLEHWLPGSSHIFSLTSSTIALFIVFLIVLLFRPQGLFGEAVQKRV